MNLQIYKLSQHALILTVITILACLNILDTDSIKFFVGIIIGNMYGTKKEIADTLTKNRK